MLQCDLTSSSYITPETSPESCSSSSKGTESTSPWSKACGYCHAEGVLLTTTDQELTTVMLIGQLTEGLRWRCGSQGFLQAL